MRVELFGTTDEIIEFFQEMANKNVSNYNFAHNVKEDLSESFKEVINRQT